jgi:hypothetical protein
MIKIIERTVISKVVILMIRETSGIFSYNLLNKKRLSRKKKNVMKTGKNISILSPSLLSPQGI